MSHERVDDLVQEALKLRYSRRATLKRATALGLSAPAISAVLARTAHAAPNRAPVHTAPAVLQGSKLNILAATYFVAAGQDHYSKAAQDWGGQNGVEVAVDYIAWPDLQPRIAAAVESGDGPDIIEIWDTWPYLYSERLVDLNDMAVAIGEAQGGYYEWVANTASVDGHFYTIPIGASSAAIAYRQSYLSEAGIADPASFPKTWDELFAKGKELKAMGKPIGQALGHSLGDPPNFAYSYMWSYGAMELDEEGNVAFNQPQFVEGMQKFIQGWKDAYDETGLGWDDAVNNRAFLSDQISMTINGSSIYATAKANEAGTSTTDYEVVVPSEDINHASYPGGPVGRFNLLGSRSYGIMDYSGNVDGAKAYLDWWYQPPQFTAWLESQDGYIIPPVPAYAELPIYTDDPKLAPYLEVVDYSRNKGYAGPANQKSAQVSSQYIIVDAFANAIQNNDAEGSIQQAAQQLERIYKR